MGLLLAKLAEALSGFQTDTPSRILMLGLDAAGKTTILYKVKLNEQVCTIPTIGFNVETVTPMKGVTFTVWDIGGQEKIRALWKRYFIGTQGLMFIVDSSDRTRLPEAREELFSIIESPEMEGVPVVVMANKQDLPKAASTTEVVDALHLRNMKGRKWYVQGTCAVDGKGIYEGMQEMAKLVKDFQQGHR